MRNGKLNGDDFDRLRDALDRLADAPIFVDDNPTPTPLQMRTMARRLQVEHGLELIIVDYMQLIDAQSTSDNLVHQVTEISRSLKAMARELNVPVLALSQLSRAVEGRPDQVPKLSDLRESGSIEQDADVVMFIYREDRVKPEMAQKGLAEIHIAKHRNGPIGKVQLRFDEEHASFWSLDRKHASPNDVPLV
jgi:replicative DNA helicase